MLRPRLPLRLRRLKSLKAELERIHGKPEKGIVTKELTRSVAIRRELTRRTGKGMDKAIKAMKAGPNIKGAKKGIRKAINAMKAEPDIKLIR